MRRDKEKYVYVNGIMLTRKTASYTKRGLRKIKQMELKRSPIEVSVTDNDHDRLEKFRLCQGVYKLYGRLKEQGEDMDGVGLFPLYLPVPQRELILPRKFPKDYTLLVFEGEGEIRWQVKTPPDEEEKFESLPIKKYDLVHIVKNTDHMVLAGEKELIGCYIQEGRYSFYNVGPFEYRI